VLEYQLVAADKKTFCPSSNCQQLSQPVGRVT